MNIFSKLCGFGLSALYQGRDVLRNRPSLQVENIPAAPNSPSFIGIEPTNICNANCVFCAYQYQERPASFMSFETFKIAIDRYVELGGGALCLTPVVGDALIDKNLTQKISYASRFKNVYPIYLYTNAILLSQEKFEEIVKAGIHKIVISTSSFKEREYKQIYRKNTYRKVLKHLFEIAESEYFKPGDVSISLRSNTLFPQFQPEYKKLKQLGYQLERTTFFDTWSGRIKPNDVPAFMFFRPLQKKRRPCHILYGGPTILVDGTITACGCRDLNGDSELVLGNIHDLPLDRPWIDGTMDKIRQRFIEGNPPNICQDCRHYVPIGKG